MTTLTTAIQEALKALEKGDTLCEINAAHILRQALADAPIDADVQRDAERYRHIRDVPYSDDVRSVLVYQQNAAMDRVIDAARAAQGGAA